MLLYLKANTDFRGEGRVRVRVVWESVDSIVRRSLVRCTGVFAFNLNRAGLRHNRAKAPRNDCSPPASARECGHWRHSESFSHGNEGKRRDVNWLS